jgi:Na+-translocating ferredoxin:NAD+ oxidoreductase RnfG subunit
MNLFSKERDLIQRIANLVLILWLVAAIFVFYSSLVNIVIQKPMLTFEEYQIQNCSKYVPNDESDDTDFCEKQYAQYKISNKDDNYYDKKSIVNALGNVVIVGTFLYFLNRRK